MLTTIPVEIRFRDLDNSAYLAAVLAEQGICSLLGYIDKLYKFLEKNDLPLLFFDKGFSPRAREDSYRRFARNRPIVQMLYEGLLAGQPGSYPANYFAPERVSAYCAWGEAQVRFYKDNLPEEHHHKIHLTGTHFFDLLHPDRFRYYRSKEVERAAGAGFLLINTNFSYATVPCGYDQWKKISPEQAMFQDPEKKRWNAMLAYETTLVDSFHSLARALRARYPDKAIVLRPHPTESVDWYEKRFADIPGVLVVNKGSVREWIYSAEAVIHNACTTGLEAFIAGKKSICYAPVLERELTDALLHDVSFQARTEDEVLHAIEHGCPLRGDQASQMRDIIDYESYNGAERIAALVRAHAAGSGAALRRLGPLRGLYWWWREHRRAIRYSLLNRVDEGAEKIRRKWPLALTGQDLRARFAALRKIMPRLPEMTVMKVAPECFLLAPAEKGRPDLSPAGGRD